jgi:hypothetical protein
MHWLQLNADNTVQTIIQSNVNLTEELGWLSISAPEYLTFTAAQNDRKGIKKFASGFVVSDAPRPSPFHTLSKSGTWSLSKTKLPLFLDQLKAETRQKIQQLYLITQEQISGGVSKVERDTWLEKAYSSQAILDNTANETQIAIIQSEADITGETIQELAEKIIRKHQRFMSFTGTLSGLKRKYEAQINQSTDAAFVEMALDEMRQQCEQLSQEFELSK